MQKQYARHRLAILLAPKADQSILGKSIDLLLALLIFLNVTAVITATVPAIGSRYEEQFEWFNIFSVLIFSLEYTLRLWTCVELDNRPISHVKKRISFFFSPMAIVDFVVILPFYVGLFLSVDLRVLRVLRLLRIFKLGRYSSAMQMLVQAFKQEYKVLFASFSILLIMMVLAASGMYMIEKDIQPEAFGSIPASMWWAMATLTTVGYGDVIPITAWGQFFGGTITLLGMGMVALPAGILASSFSQQAHQKREIFKLKIREALANGKITQKKLAELEQLRQQLEIERSQAEIMFNMMNRHNTEKTLTHCPHCQNPI
jgi:voltage-gated potassium channel